MNYIEFFRNVKEMSKLFIKHFYNKFKFEFENNISVKNKAISSSRLISEESSDFIHFVDNFYMKFCKENNFFVDFDMIKDKLCIVVKCGNNNKFFKREWNC